MQAFSSSEIAKSQGDGLKNLFGQRYFYRTLKLLLSPFSLRFIQRSVLTIQHYNDWKPRRRTFDPAFARRYDGQRVCCTGLHCSVYVVT